MSMANTVVEPVPPEAHFQVCQLHDQKGLATCSAYLKRGNFKCSKQATMREPHMLATCKLHRGQLKPASRCQVQLSCGDKCAKICEWRLHAVQRCVAHTDAPTPSYFLKIPLELRARVYAYLLPEKTCQEPRTLLQARAEGASSQYQPSKQVFMDICRVNRQIHTEVTTLLYGSSMFTIWLTASGLHMGMATPNSAQSSVRNPVYVTYPSRQGSHALNDYQMKLILLEQTNAKVLAAHRFNNVFTGGTPSQQAAPMMRMQQLRAQANPALAESSSRSSESHRLMRRLQPRVSDFGTRREPSLATSISTLTAQPQGHADAPSSEWPVWDAQLSTKYFNMIQSFRINIVCPFYACSHVKTRLSTSHGLGVPKSQSVQIDASTYEYIDHLHKLVSRLEIASPRIYRLEVCIQFEHEPDEIQDLPMLDLLLRPFLRLCNIPCATAMIITPSYLARVRNSPNVYPPPRDGTLHVVPPGMVADSQQADAGGDSVELFQGLLAIGKSHQDCEPLQPGHPVHGLTCGDPVGL